MSSSGTKSERKVKNFLNKTTYNFLSESSKPWTETVHFEKAECSSYDYNTHQSTLQHQNFLKTMMNRSSVTHNIISGEDNYVGGRLPVQANRINKQLLYKRKSITDYANEQASHALH